MLLGLKPDTYAVTSIYAIAMLQFLIVYMQNTAITFYLKNVFVWCAVYFHPKQTGIRKKEKLTELFRLLLLPTIVTICLFFIEQKQFERVFSMFRGKIFEVFYLK